MKSLYKIAAGVLTAAIVGLAVSPVFADSPGQLTGGAQVLQVKNLTKGGVYASTVSAACGDELQYSVMLHNAAFGGLTNIVVKANLSNGTITATPAEGASQGTSGSVTVSVASGGTLAYENGSTVLYDSKGAVIKTLPDTITTSGVNIGNMNGSTTEFVNYKAKVNCPTPTPTPTPSPTPTPPAPQVESKTTTLPNTGAGGVLGLFAGATVLATAGHYIVRRLRQA